MARRVQPAGFRVKAEADNGTGVLVRGQQKCPGRVDDKIAGRSALSGFVAYIRKLACLRINSIDNDTVMAPVGAIEEAA